MNQKKNTELLNAQCQVQPQVVLVGREMVFKTVFKKSPSDPTEITAFLFDHAVLLVRIKTQGKTEEVKAYRRVSAVPPQHSNSCDINIISAHPVRVVID